MTSTPSAGPAAVAISAARRSTASAIAPSATAAMPPSPVARPTDMPDAIAMRLGRYSWLSTIVTPKVLTITAPAVHTATAPTMPPAATYSRISPGVSSMLPRSTSRRPNRSASGPAQSVPATPASRTSDRSVLPYDFEWPRETSQSGTNVNRP